MSTAAHDGMVVTCWGVRGSTPMPGPATLRYGGNTACVSVETAGLTLVLDAGTGIHRLGQRLAGGGGPILVLLTHPHLDHVQGFPFFAPLFEPGREVRVVDFDHDGRVWSPLMLFDGVFFPLHASELAARVERVGFGELTLDGIDVDRHAVHHPGGAYGFRIRRGGRSLVYVPDNELGATPPEERERLVDWCRDADVLIHDAQYLPGDMPDKQGWGHSLVEEACALARDAQVQQLLLFHHDPERDDDALVAIEAHARTRVADTGIRCQAAYEGLTLALQPKRIAVPTLTTAPPAS